MLSAKGRVCNNKVGILDKMTALRKRLQGYIQQGEQKVQKREADADAAKQAWLDAEGAYLVDKKKAESLDAQVVEDLKKVTSLMELLELNKKRLAKVRASVTEQLSEIDEEEAIIRELLGYIGDLTSSTVDTVRLHLPFRACVRAPRTPRMQPSLPARPDPFPPGPNSFRARGAGCLVVGREVQPGRHQAHAPPRPRWPGGLPSGLRTVRSPPRLLPAPGSRCQCFGPMRPTARVLIRRRLICRRLICRCVDPRCLAARGVRPAGALPRRPRLEPRAAGVC